MVSGGRTSDRDVEAMSRAMGLKQDMFTTKKSHAEAQQKLRDLISKTTGEGRISDTDKKRMQSIIDSLPTGKDFDSIVKRAREVMSTTDASTAKSYTPNDKKMYGGKARKK
jgi:hypothetical protein